MITRKDVLSEAVENCLKELYSYAQPKVEWDDFVKQNKEWKEGTPHPYEFYYIPENVLKEIVESYVVAYRIDYPTIQEHFDVLLNYLKAPLYERYSEEFGRYFDNLTPLQEIIGFDNFEKVEEYIKQAKEFYNTKYDLNSFNMSIYLGPSPNSNKQAVIDNWKLCRNIDVTIDESIYKNEF